MSTPARSFGASPAALVAGGCLTGTLWAVAVALLARDTGPLVLVPPLLASFALTLFCGLWFGGRGRDEAQAAAETRCALAEAQLRLAAGRQDRATRQLRALLDHIAPAAALFDAELRLIAWTRSVAALLDAVEQPLALGQSLRDLVRQQPGEAERRLPLDRILAGTGGHATRERHDGSTAEDHWEFLADGSLLLCCKLREAQASLPAALLSECARDLRTRLPLLRGALAAGELSVAQVEAQAMRGVAAKFGLTTLATTLLGIEAALRERRPDKIDPRLVQVSLLLERDLAGLGAA